MDRLPRTNTELAAYLKRYAKTAQDFAADLDLTPQQVQELLDTSTEFTDALKAHKNAHTKARVATHKKDEARAKATEAFRKISRMVAVNTAVSPQDKQRFGLPVRDSKAPKEPFIPDRLVPQYDPRGAVKLRWLPNGNKWGVIYTVVAIDAQRKRTLLGSTTKCSYTVGANEATDAELLAVFAQRGRLHSPLSNLSDRWCDGYMRPTA